MQHPELIELMDKAAAIAGSDYKLAQIAGVTRQQISNWRAGRAPCPPEEVGTLAHIAGLDGGEWTLRAMLWKYEGTAKGERLVKVLGKSLPAIVAAMASSGASAATWICSSTTSLMELVNTMYIPVNMQKNARI